MKFDIACLVSSTQTSGQMAAFAENVPPGAGPPLHAHQSQTEVFHVVSGTFLFERDGQHVTLGAGGSIVVPPGAAHAFKNIGDIPGRLHFDLLPAGSSEAFFQRIVADVASIQDLGAFFAEHEIALLGPPLA